MTYFLHKLTIFLVLFIHFLFFPMILVQHPNFHLINDDRCGLHSPRQRIHNGRNANLGEFPWMVYIETHKTDINGSEAYSTCGGSILNRNYILSAAHCFVDSKAKQINFKLVIGEYNKKTNPDCVNNVCAPNVIIYEPEEVIIHPNYFSFHAGFDISLIRVRGFIDFNEFVAPICLEHGYLMTHDYAGENGQVAGWGIYGFVDYKRKEPLLPDVLQTLAVPILDDEGCRKTLEQVAYEFKDYHVIESQVCAGGVVEKFAYQGDSGGPLMTVKQMGANNVPRFYQIGVVSFGPFASEFQFVTPTVYTRVRYYLTWILDNMRP